MQMLIRIVLTSASWGSTNRNLYEGFGLDTDSYFSLCGMCTFVHAMCVCASKCAVFFVCMCVACYTVFVCVNAWVFLSLCALYVLWMSACVFWLVLVAFCIRYREHSVHVYVYVYVSNGRGTTLGVDITICAHFTSTNQTPSALSVISWDEWDDLRPRRLTGKGWSGSVVERKDLSWKFSNQ